MKIQTGLVLLLLGSLIVSTVHADQILFATAGDNPPFIMKNNKGELYGFEIDLVRALCYQLKADCEIEEQNNKNFTAGLKDKKYDAFISARAISVNQNREFSYSDPYYSRYLRFIGKKGSKLELSNKWLKGKELGVLKSDLGEKFLKENFQDSPIIKLYDDLDAAFQDLKLEKLEAVLVDAYQGYRWLLQADNSGYDLVGDKVDVNQRFSIAVEKGNRVLLGKLNGALKTIRENGTYKRITWNYFPYDVY